MKNCVKGIKIADPKVIKVQKSGKKFQCCRFSTLFTHSLTLFQLLSRKLESLSGGRGQEL